MKIIKATSLLLSVMLFTLSVAGCHSEPLLQSNEPDSVSEPPSITISEPVEESVPEPEPDNDWEFDSPENHGVDGELLDQMHTALASTRIHSAVTVKDGVIIDEYYQDGYNDASIFPIHSASKSVTSALIGIAIEEGLISGVDAKLSEYLPQAAATDKADIHFRRSGA